MAPALVDPLQPAAAASFRKGLVRPKEAFIGGPDAYSKTAEEKGTASQPTATHPKHLPVWNPDTRCPALEPFTHYEHGKDADLTFRHLFDGAASVADSTPSTGTRVCGVQLSNLSDKRKDQLALFTAQRKVIGV